MACTGQKSAKEMPEESETAEDAMASLAHETSQERTASLSLKRALSLLAHVVESRLAQPRCWPPCAGRWPAS